MLKAVVAVCLVGSALCGPPVSRTRGEIQEFRDFLESTRTDEGLRVTSSLEGSAWENSGKYQGDILLDDEQLESMVEQFSAGRNAYIWPNTKWPERTIIYDFAAGQFTAAQREAILQSIRTIESRTCVRFRQRRTERNYVLLTTRNSGCYANVGYWSTRGVHTMNLQSALPGRGCFHPTVIIHEWLHIIGFFHMQSTHDRDTYVRINWQNIQRNMEHNFERYASNRVDNLGLPYEYDSVMHYGPLAFSINRLPTIEALRSHPGVMGQQEYVTANDFRRVDRHYNCVAWRSEDQYQDYNVQEQVNEQVEEISNDQ